MRTVRLLTFNTKVLYLYILYYVYYILYYIMLIIYNSINLIPIKRLTDIINGNPSGDISVLTFESLDSGPSTVA